MAGINAKWTGGKQYLAADEAGHVVVTDSEGQGFKPPDLLLADFLVQRCSKKLGKPINRISTMAIDMMLAYHWPGNVRELENVVERALILNPDGPLTLSDFNIRCTERKPDDR
ncbi:MAG: hypothetical protein ACK2U9_19610, partial [Anaerolineae bacterium]